MYQQHAQHDDQERKSCALYIAFAAHQLEHDEMPVLAHHDLVRRQERAIPACRGSAAEPLRTSSLVSGRWPSATHTRRANKSKASA